MKWNMVVKYGVESDLWLSSTQDKGMPFQYVRIENGSKIWRNNIEEDTKALKYPSNLDIDDKFTS